MGWGRGVNSESIHSEGVLERDLRGGGEVIKRVNSELHHVIMK